MQKKFGLTILAVAVAGMSFGQIKKQFSVEDAPSCDKIKLTLKANSGTCFIKPSHNPEILNVFSNQSENNYSHQFVKEINGKTCQVMLSLEETQSDGFKSGVFCRHPVSSEQNHRFQGAPRHNGSTLQTRYGAAFRR